MEHKQLVEQAGKAIRAVFGDTSVDQQTTRDSLEELVEEIEVMLDTLK